jgi:hypothetical protein
VHRFRLPASLAAATAVLFAASTAAAQPAPTDPPPPPPDTLTEEEARAIAAEVARQMIEQDKAVAATEAAKIAAEEQKGIDVVVEGAKQAEPEDYLSGSDGFADVRLNFTLTNENIFAEPGETVPSVPGWRFGRPNSLGTLFFDNYDTRFSGYETLSHAVLYRNYRKDHLEVEGGLVLRINELTERTISFSDAGSYILTSWWKDPSHNDPSRVSVTVFPISSDRFRLGYSYRLSWGGNEEYRRRDQAVPGIKVQYDLEDAYAFIGAKTATVLDPTTAELKAVQAVLAGAGYDISDMIRVELNGGFFDRGNNEQEDVNDQSVQLFGGSAQVAVHDGMPVQSSVDYKLYKYDPERIGRVYQKVKYPGGVQWLAMIEGTILGQTLKDPEESGSTKIQWGAAGDLNVRAMVDRFRFRADLQYRDLAFILHSVPSLPSYSDFPEVYDIQPNFFAAAGVDHNWDDRYTAGVIVGVELPATLTSPTGIPGDTAAMGESTAVIRNNGQSTIISILPEGEKRAAQLATKFTGQIDFGTIYSAVADVYFAYDPNQTRLKRVDEDNPESLLTYEFGEFNQLGVNLTLQARF